MKDGRESSFVIVTELNLDGVAVGVPLQNLPSIRCCVIAVVVCEILRGRSVWFDSYRDPGPSLPSLVVPSKHRMPVVRQPAIKSALTAGRVAFSQMPHASPKRILGIVIGKTATPFAGNKHDFVSGCPVRPDLSTDQFLVGLGLSSVLSNAQPQHRQHCQSQ